MALVVSLVTPSMEPVAAAQSHTTSIDTYSMRAGKEQDSLPNREIASAGER